MKITKDLPMIFIFNGTRKTILKSLMPCVRQTKKLNILQNWMEDIINKKTFKYDDNLIKI